VVSEPVAVVGVVVVVTEGALVRVGANNKTNSPRIIIIHNTKTVAHPFAMYSSISNMPKFITLLPLLIVLTLCGPTAHAQDPSTDSTGSTSLTASIPPQPTSDGLNDVVTYIKAQVTEVNSNYQSIKAKLLDGPDTGIVIAVDNDYLFMKPGDVFYFRHTVNSSEGINFYSVSEPYRLPTLAFFIGLFLLCLFIFGGKQGLRGLLALIASFFFIAFLLLPAILHGYSPILVSLGVSSLIIILGSYVTHGFNRTTTAAVVGMLITIAITGALAYAAIHSAHLSGFTNEESAFLNFNTDGKIDFVGLLLGSLLIGFLGVLYDAAISQAIAVEEFFGLGQQLSTREVYLRALRIGREHIGALVNTLAIAYVGVSLPLLLLFVHSNLDPLLTVNQEVFATEILRMMIGSIGLILAVPITTAVAVYMLKGKVIAHQGTGAGHHH
jgi:uncharacterized membrane protein